MIQTLARTYPFLNGYGRIANLPLVQQIIDSHTSEGVTGTLQNGASFTAPSEDHVGRAAWLFGDLDPKLTRLADILIHPGDHVVDIGANFGLFSLHAASMVGSSGRVESIEPQPALVGMLRRSIAENNMQQIRVHETALGARDTVATLSIPSNNSGAASLVRRRSDDVRLPVMVQRSGSFLANLGEEHFRFVKIDVEGLEADIIRGALAFLNRRKPDVMFFEAQEHQRYEDNAAVSLLAECGYSCYPVLPSLRKVRLAGPNYTGSLKGVHDVLAVAPGIVGHDVMNTLKASGVHLA